MLKNLSVGAMLAFATVSSIWAFFMIMYYEKLIAFLAILGMAPGPLIIGYFLVVIVEVLVVLTLVIGAVRIMRSNNVQPNLKIIEKLSLIIGGLLTLLLINNWQLLRLTIEVLRIN